jgi:hypothetical protein
MRNSALSASNSRGSADVEDNRLAGLVVVIAVLIFLWLYDTGKWGAVAAAVTGTPTPSSAATGAATGLGAAAGAATVGSVSYDTQIFCNTWPTACPYDSGLTTQPAATSPSGGGTGSLLSGIASVGSFIAGLF